MKATLGEIVAVVLCVAVWGLLFYGLYGRTASAQEKDPNNDRWRQRILDEFARDIQRCRDLGGVPILWLIPSEVRYAGEYHHQLSACDFPSPQIGKAERDR